MQVGCRRLRQLNTSNGRCCCNRALGELHSIRVRRCAPRGCWARLQPVGLFFRARARGETVPSGRVDANKFSWARGWCGPVSTQTSVGADCDGEEGAAIEQIGCGDSGPSRGAGGMISPPPGVSDECRVSVESAISVAGSRPAPAARNRLGEHAVLLRGFSSQIHSMGEV